MRWTRGGRPGCIFGSVASYTVVLSKEPSGWYSAVCPAMPGAISQGESHDAAIVNIVEAMAGWYEVSSERGLAPLKETSELVGQKVSEVLGFLAEEGWPLLVETAVVHLPTVVAA